MAPLTSGPDLVARVRKMRDAPQLPADCADLLERARKYLHDHETTSANEATHAVFDSYHDWWVGQKSTFKLAIVEDNTLDLLHKHIAALYDLGVPLMLAERRSKEIRFVQDLCIYGSAEETIPAADFLGADGAVLRLLGRVMGDVFPSCKFLDLFIYDGSGPSRKKGVMKTSVRLVYNTDGGLVVDKERALCIHDYMVCRFLEESDQSPELSALHSRMQAFSSDNTWTNFFSAEVYQGKNFVRMPLCDRVSPQPMQSPENRPFKPIEAVRYDYKDGALESMEHLAGPDDLENHVWVKVGTLRQEENTPLSEWKQPTRNGKAIPRAAPLPASVTQAPAVAPGERRFNKASVRTRNGSDKISHTARPLRNTAPVKEESTTVAERQFDGTTVQFKERLEEALGPQGDCFEENEAGRIVWKKEGRSGAQIEFREHNQRVYVRGKTSQVRNLLAIVSSFSHAVGESARSVTMGARTTRTAASISGGSRVSMIVPSAVYAPRDTASASGSNAFSNAGYVGADATAAVLPVERKATQDFQSEGPGEICLTVGDHVTISSDPDASTAVLYRWVYGKNHTTGESGWFPFSHAEEKVELPAVADDAP